MRNRQLVAKWAYEKGKDANVIEKRTQDGKTYFVVNDYAKLRVIFGELLKENRGEICGQAYVRSDNRLSFDECRFPLRIFWC